MTPHESPQILIPVLVTCPNCSGETTYHTEADGLCACRFCENGYMAIAVPMRDFLAVSALPEDQRHAALLAKAQEHGKVRHPLLYGVVGTPTSYRTPLRNNPGDEKRRIPLTEQK